jgi:hypothetical protein
MDNAIHRFSELFAQLGLANDAKSIASFLIEKAPLPGHISLPDAPFWSHAQASFLREALADNADWAELVDQLNEALRLP